MFLLNIIILISVSYFDIYLKTPKRGHFFKAGFTCGLDRVTLRVLSQLTPSEDYLGLLTPVTFSVLIKVAVSH